MAREKKASSTTAGETAQDGGAQASWEATSPSAAARASTKGLRQSIRCENSPIAVILTNIPSLAKPLVSLVVKPAASQ